jgi:MATE family multidrug resistance protein
MTTTSPEVRDTARAYLVWAALTPIVGVWCFQLDGIFIGATRTADMRNMMLLSLAVYVAAWSVLAPAFGNHGLWASLHVFYVVRLLTLWARLPALERAAFG